MHVDLYSWKHQHNVCLLDVIGVTMGRKVSSLRDKDPKASMEAFYLVEIERLRRICFVATTILVLHVSRNETLMGFVV